MESQVTVQSATSNLNFHMSPNSKTKPTRLNLDEDSSSKQNPTSSPTKIKKPLLTVPPPVSGEL